MATVLHELLAVENGLAETANRVQKETTKTLGTKETLFTGLNKSHIIFAEENQHLVQAPEIKEVQSTVDEQLLFLGSNLARYWDVTLQKETTNQHAKGNITIGGIDIATDVPAIVLLSMEKKLTALLATYNAIPTLDSSKSWDVDAGHAKLGVFRTAHPRENQHTVTYKTWEEVSAATKEHKAQIVQVEKTDVIGKYVLVDYSGALTSLDKANKLKRLTQLIAAVKTARQRANNQEVDTTATFGSALLDYING